VIANSRFNSSITRRPLIYVGLCALVCLCLNMTTAQDAQPKDGRYYEALAGKAYAKKDYAGFLANMKQAAALRPNHPRLTYNSRSLMRWYSFKSLAVPLCLRGFVVNAF
jgi:hypothetical protein